MCEKSLEEREARYLAAVASVPPQKIKHKKGVLQGPKKWLATTETALLEAEFHKKGTKW